MCALSIIDYRVCVRVRVRAYNQSCDKGRKRLRDSEKLWVGQDHVYTKLSVCR